MAIVILRRCLLAVLLSCLAVDGLAKKKLTAVEDLRYGVALYHYYQGDYMEALTELLIAKEKGGIKGHGDNPEIMEGGFSLGFGLERHASDIFERLLAENRSKRSRDAAWFFLSKLRYLRADWQGAEEALAKVKKPAVEIRNDVIAHRINLAIKQNKLELAERLIRKKKPERGWMPYIYFNLGAAYAREQRYDDAVRNFNILSKSHYRSDELRALYDKAMTSAGYSYLLSERYPEAIEQFSKVRLTSVLSGRALLGYGWAEVKLGQYEEALKPWQYLAENSLVDENSQEAQVAVPYAYEKLGKEGLALASFQKAEENFLAEMARLDAVIESTQGNQLLDALKIERSEGMDWLKYVRDNQLSPQLSYLAELFSREDFQGLVQELRDLLGIQQDLIDWQEKLKFYEDMLATREQGRKLRAERLAARELTTTIKTMKAERSALAKKIEKIAAERDYFALASEDQRELIDRVLRSQKSIELLRETDPFIDESEEAVRRYYGILYWEASEQFSDRLWRAVKTLSRLDKTLATVTRNHEKVQYIIDNAEDLQPLMTRTLAMQDRVEIELARIGLAVDNTQEDLRRRTNQVLLTQRGRLNHYLAQSRLSIARLYDKAHQFEAESTLAPDPLDSGAVDSQDSPEPENSPEQEGTEIAPSVIDNGDVNSADTGEAQ